MRSLSHSLFAPLISLFGRLIGFFLAQHCRVRTAHQPLSAPVRDQTSEKRVR